MRPNIVSEAGLPTRLNQWWASVPFITSGIVFTCGIIYLVCLLVGYDSFSQICFSPFEIISHFQVYRMYTSVLFHGSLLHVLFNMLALVPLGTELERIMGSVRLLYLMLLLATTNSVFHLIIALLVANNPIHPLPFLETECAIGFSGILFAMIVIETSLSGIQSRSVFGLFNVPAKWYAWILLILFQFLASNVSFLGHLCGILSGFAYTNGLLNYLLPGPSFYSSIESSSILSFCVRRPRFILCTGGTTYGQLPTYTSTTAIPDGLRSGNLWRNISSWMPQRGASPAQSSEDPRFPGRGRALGSTRNQSAGPTESDVSLQARLLDNSTRSLEPLNLETQPTAARRLSLDTEVGSELVANNQGLDNFEEELKKLVVMGFEKTQAEVALAAADGDPNVAIEILMSQQQ
ncbi:rhomboid-like protein 15 isoform X2 [Curcuma longa]